MKFSVSIGKVNNFEAYFLLVKDGKHCIIADNFISKNLNISIEQYHDRLTEKVINHVHHTIDTSEAYFDLRENDITGKKMLINKFKEEFVTELTSLNLS